MALGLSVLVYSIRISRFRRERVINSGFLPAAFLRPIITTRLLSCCVLCHISRTIGGRIMSAPWPLKAPTRQIGSQKEEPHITLSLQVKCGMRIRSLGFVKWICSPFVVLDTILPDQRLPVAIRPRTSSTHDVFCQESAASLLGVPSGRPCHAEQLSRMNSPPLPNATLTHHHEIP
ncbi:hypothetical protein CGRA01v4_03834 [Colletotrichum graminicola]|nr:hypothetical protein CGRA01v4_03834 [Colletotrichum graminicola]